MAEQLFPVFDLPDESDEDEEEEEKYSPSVMFDFDEGDFIRDGAARMVEADGKEAFRQWCLKMASTERYECLAYSEDMGVEFAELVNLSDRQSRESHIELTITEALLMHPATEMVKDFVFEHEGDQTHVEFTVKGYPWEEELLISTTV